MRNLHEVTPTNAQRRTPIVRHYANIGEIIENADRIMKDEGHSYATGSRWTYGNDWQDEPATRAGLLAGEAPAAALAAYDALRSQYEADTLTTATPAPTRRRRQVWADQGDEIDTDRMNAGRETPWRSTRIGRSAPIVRLALNIGISAGNGPEQFAQVAATAAAIADALTLSGYAVEIVGCEIGINNKYAKGANVYTFPLKSSHEPLDARRILSAAAPGLLRAYLIPQLLIDTASNTAGKCVIPHNAAELIGTPHIIARHWENGREISPTEQARRIIDASKSAAA